MALHAMPPTEFQKLLQADFLSLASTNEIFDCVQIKATSTDREPVKLSKELVYWMTETLAKHQDALRLLPNEAPTRFTGTTQRTVHELYYGKLKKVHPTRAYLIGGYCKKTDKLFL